MASAVLAGQNEWAQSNYMAKLPNHPNHLNPNPNPNSFPKKKHRRPAANEDSPAVTQASSDDAYSFNQRPIDKKSDLDCDFDFDFNPGNYVSFDVSGYTKTEILRVRERLVAELDSVRRLNSRIESGKLSNQKKKRPNPNPNLNPNHVKDLKRLRREVKLDPAEIENLLKLCKQVLGKVMKHKLSWVFKKPVDAAALGLHDYHQIVKEPMDLGTVKSNLAKNLYSDPGEFADHVRLVFSNAMLYNPQGDEVHKMAELLLDRFEELFSPIQAKLKLESLENNVETDELQGSSWNVSPTPEKSVKKSKTKPKTKPKPNLLPVDTPMPIQVPNPPVKKSERVETSPKKSEKPETAEKVESLPILEPVPNPPMSPPQQQAPAKPTVVRERLPKLPKPRAKDPNKRAMSMEEQHKLSIGLQNLPQEKMTQLVHIIKKRNAHMVQDGDEIELDIEAIDTETLWELDRFVTNWKKMVSKAKRQALMVNTNPGFAPVETETASGDDIVVSASERSEGAKKMEEVEGGEDDVDIGDDVDVGAEVDVGGDVDIGDDVPMSSFLPVEIENEKEDAVGANDNIARAASSSSSSSGSSSSDSSSSSDTDSGSSSGSDSDADDAQSKGNQSKQRLEE